METDEKDGQGRRVKVTESSFDEHCGIAERTFRRWVGQSGQRGRPASEATGSSRTAEMGLTIARGSTTPE